MLIKVYKQYSSYVKYYSLGKILKRSLSQKQKICKFSDNNESLSVDKNKNWNMYFHYVIYIYIYTPLIENFTSFPLEYTNYLDFEVEKILLCKFTLKNFNKYRLQIYISFENEACENVSIPV